MKSSTNQQRRTVFTTDAKLAIRRAPAATMAAGSDETPADEPKVTLEGYAMVWNTLSSDRGGFRVKLLPGSAKFTPEVHALFHHDFRAILGATGNNTLRLSSDNVGVKVEIDLPDTQCAADVAELVEDKYVRGMSFSMLWDGIEYDVRDADTDDEVMEVKSFLCDEVTVTAIPSFTDTTIGLKDGQADADDEQPAESKPEPAYARIEQTIRLERLRLENLTL
jgi:HK97 family phage prohead protease